jgi:hypothetical protein
MFVMHFIKIEKDCLCALLYLPYIPYEVVCTLRYVVHHIHSSICAVSCTVP